MQRLMMILCSAPLCAFAAAETHVVEANSTWFSPSEITVIPGDTIRWEYGSGYPHTVTSGTDCTASGLFDAPLSGSGAFFEWIVPADAPASIPYFCMPHCAIGMTGLIHVTIPAGPSVLSFGTHELDSSGSGWVKVMWQSDASIVGFQFNLIGATITGVDSGLTEEYQWVVDHNGTLVLAYAFGTPAIPPQGNTAHLLTLAIESAGAELSLNGAIFVGADGDPLKVDATDVLDLGGCDADVNGDGLADVTDLLAVIAAWGTTGGAEDVNGDGTVDVSDLLAIISAWGPC
ncbi:MAG: plastocyanin/azurin family copper-binding protein [Phycisphaerales bacterium]|jgi:plastocyanin|nr:plastocyanin/azurin family copper-binding protein [Phycisphaerales bacterium]